MASFLLEYWKSCACNYDCGIVEMVLHGREQYGGEADAWEDCYDYWCMILSHYRPSSRTLVWAPS